MKTCQKGWSKMGRGVLKYKLKSSARTRILPYHDQCPRLVFLDPPPIIFSQIRFLCLITASIALINGNFRDISKTDGEGSKNTSLNFPKKRDLKTNCQVYDFLGISQVGICFKWVKSVGISQMGICLKWVKSVNYTLNPFETNTY